MADAKRSVIDKRMNPFVIVTRKVIEDETLKASDKSVYAVLCMYADNRTKECYPSRETLLKKSGISDKPLRNSLRVLSDKGYIEIKERYNSVGRTSNRYILLDV